MGSEMCIRDRLKTMEKESIDIRNKANDELSKIFYIGLKHKGKF